MDFVTEQLLKEFRAKFDKTELCWFFFFAEQVLPDVADEW